MTLQSTIPSQYKGKKGVQERTADMFSFLSEEEKIDLLFATLNDKVGSSLYMFSSLKTTMEEKFKDKYG